MFLVGRGILKPDWETALPDTPKPFKQIGMQCCSFKPEDRPNFAQVCFLCFSILKWKWFFVVGNRYVNNWEKPNKLCLEWSEVIQMVPWMVRASVLNNYHLQVPLAICLPPVELSRCFQPLPKHPTFSSPSFNSYNKPQVDITDWSCFIIYYFAKNFLVSLSVSRVTLALAEGRSPLEKKTFVPLNFLFLTLSILIAFFRWKFNFWLSLLAFSRLKTEKSISFTN